MLTPFLLTASLIFPLLRLLSESALRLLPFQCWIVSIWQDFIPPPTHCGAPSSAKRFVIPLAKLHYVRARDSQSAVRRGLLVTPRPAPAAARRASPSPTCRARSSRAGPAAR